MSVLLAADLIWQVSRVAAAGTAAFVAVSLYWMFVMSQVKMSSLGRPPAGALQITYISMLVIAAFLAVYVYPHRSVFPFHVANALWFAFRLSGLLILIQLSVRIFDLVKGKQTDKWLMWLLTPYRQH